MTQESYSNPTVNNAKDMGERRRLLVCQKLRISAAGTKLVIL